jgi:hypothetical protein
VWVLRAKQYTQPCPQPRYGLIVQWNGIREDAGTLLMIDLACTS